MARSLFKASIIKDTGTTAKYGLPSLERQKERVQPVLTPAQVAEKTEREAYEKGYEAGEQAGFRIGQQKAGLLLDRLEKIIQELGNIRDNEVRELSPKAFSIALELCRKILLEEVTLRPELMVNMIKESVRKIERSGQITIKINPALFELIKEHRQSLLDVHQDIVFDIDPSASKMGAVVIGPADEVVTDIDEQLANIKDDIEKSLGMV